MTSRQRWRGADGDAGSADTCGTHSISAAAHEMRTPLTAILGFAEVLRADARELEDGEVKTMLEHIITNARAEVRIIERWLGDGTKTNGNGTHRPGFDLRREIDAFRDELAPVMNSHTLDVRVAKRLRVEGDPDALREVLSNLVTNAVKYSFLGSTITVTAHSVPGFFTVVVSSKGDVIEEDALQHLFDEGYRVSPDTGPLGSGLGLGIARNLVTQLGGRIWAESDADGTRFIFTLRRARLSPVKTSETA